MLPIFIRAHTSNGNARGHRYVQFCLNQASKSNPENRIIFCTDLQVKAPRNVEVYPYDYYASDLSREFDKVYLHLSSNPKNYEAAALRTMFFSEEFLQKEKIPGCVCLDSDILILGDLDKLHQDWFAGYDATYMSDKFTPQTSFFTKEFLQYYCKFVIKFYTNPKLRNSLETLYEKMKSNKVSGGICDTSFLKWIGHQLYEPHNFKFRDNMRIHNGQTFDHMVTHPQGGFVMENRIKKIEIKDGKAYGFLEKNKIEFLTLHFQGLFKKHIEKTYNTLNAT